jgi:ubiquinone/menaquinone biosynthesis C-methylase UbiE
MSDVPTTNESVCPWWLSFFLSNPLRRLIHKPEAILAAHVRTGDVALDIGCGPGYFTLPLARLVGPAGSVIAVDLQPQMLDILRRRAEHAGLLSRIRLHRCATDRLGVETPVDFALAFAMVHETPDAGALLAEVAALLKPGGRFLLAEPRAHVTTQAFEATLAHARTAGLRPCAEPRIAMSRAVLLTPSASGFPLTRE